ncbi:MAG TPA: ABC transporter ATP-binding protein [Bacteroidia bacterium]|nr:ABC transporter ATP-binding protein [Bacteroidia bacterium]HNU32470.1 ABC transporter ATP-binding protein [Bacteroidia bacterium]
MPVVIKNIKKKYGTLDVLKQVSLTVNDSEVVAIVGPSGAGKTTLLQIVGTIEKPDSGSVVINNEAIEKFSGNKLASFRNKHIGFVFQFHHLLPEFTALENVCIPAFIGGKSKSEAEKKAKELFSFLNIENRIHHKPSELSGGEQQRVAVARALINNPSIVLADEPSGNLDTQHALELHNLFFELRKKTGQTFIIVTHNTELAQMADRKIEMRDGEII